MFSEYQFIAETFGENIHKVHLKYSKLLDLMDPIIIKEIAFIIFEDVIEESKLKLLKWGLNLDFITDYSVLLENIQEKDISEKEYYEIANHWMQYSLYLNLKPQVLYEYWDMVIAYAKKEGFDCIKSFEELKVILLELKVKLDILP